MQDGGISILFVDRGEMGFTGTWEADSVGGTTGKQRLVQIQVRTGHHMETWVV